MTQIKTVGQTGECEESGVPRGKNPAGTGID